MAQQLYVRTSRDKEEAPTVTVASMATKYSRSATPGHYYSKPVSAAISPRNPFGEAVVRTYAVKSRKGYMPDKPSKQNQDAYFVCPDFARQRNVWLAGVCDGHGVNGHLVSDYIRTALPDNVELSQRNRTSSAEDEEMKDGLYLLRSKARGIAQESRTVRGQVLRDAVIATEKGLEAQSIDIDYSGSTLVFVLLSGERVTCANVGDSRAVMASQRQKSGGKVWVATPLSRDHKPDLPDEERRILNSGGRIEPFKGSAPANRYVCRHDGQPAGSAASLA